MDIFAVHAHRIVTLAVNLIFAKNVQALTFYIKVCAIINAQLLYMVIQLHNLVKIVVTDATTVQIAQLA